MYNYICLKSCYSGLVLLTLTELPTLVHLFALVVSVLLLVELNQVFKFSPVVTQDFLLLDTCDEFD